MPYLSSLTTSTADLKLTWSINAKGQTVVDFVLGPDGNLMLVTGINRLVQDVKKWLLTPQGTNPMDPTYGNPLFSLIGRPQGLSTSLIESMVQQCQDDFIARQASASASGYLSLDEQVAAFTNLQVTLGDNVQAPLGTVLISFTVNARSGVNQTAVVPFSSTFFQVA